MHSNKDPATAKNKNKLEKKKTIKHAHILQFNDSTSEYSIKTTHISQVSDIQKVTDIQGYSL